MDYFNFCHCRLSPSVTSSAVSTEGYEVTNLISEDASKRQKGFMVYQTIHPPVDITFTFMCKINISHIFIWPQVGSQKSSGFQISTSTAKTDSGQSKQSFISVGSGYIQSEPGIIFHHAYEPRSSNVNNFLRRRLSIKQNCLSAVSSVQIRIVKTYQSSVPAILKIEIWGLPSVSCPKEVRMKVLDLWASKDKKTRTVKVVEKKTDENVLRTTAKALVESSFEIPEEFLDPITCEIMVLPYTLPSGKVVDQMTLEKHENHEANWGRRPSDPFTGKQYTETIKPVLAVALKARIDKFLIEHSNIEELKTVPRTVGRKLPSSSSTQKSDGVRNVILEAFKSQNNSKGDTKLVHECSETTNCDGNKYQRFPGEKCKAKSELSEERSKKRRFEKDILTYSEARQCGSSSENTSNSPASCSKRSHEDLVNDSLNAALKSALSGLPSFTNFSKKVQDTEIKCIECSSKQMLYELPCQHLLCRMCLTKKTFEKPCLCSCCHLPFNSGDPKRYHS